MEEKGKEKNDKGKGKIGGREDEENCKKDNQEKSKRRGEGELLIDK